MSTFNNRKSSFGNLTRKMGIGVEEEKEHIRTIPPAAVNNANKSNATIIASDVIVVGDISTREDFELNGEVEGNIESRGTVRINGKVKGDVKALNVFFQHASFTGNIISEDKIMIDNDTSIIGDISAKSVTIDGYLQGNTVADEDVTIKSQAVIQGNVTAKQICINQGAKIIGSFETKSAPEPAEIDIDKTAFIDETTSSILASLENEEEPLNADNSII